MQTQPMSPGGAAEAFYGWTVIQLILMAIGAIIVIAGMIYGRRLARQRHRAEEAAEERADQAGVDLPEAGEQLTVEVQPEPVTKLPDPDLPVVTPELEPVPAPVYAPQPEPAPVEIAPPPPEPEPAPQPSSPLALTTIKGLGPKVATMLAERGITSVDQLGALSPDQARELDVQLGAFTGRMARDRWIEQAKLLASGDTAAYEAEFGKLG